MGDISMAIFLWGEFFFATCFRQIMFFCAKNNFSSHLATMAIGSANPGHCDLYFMIQWFVPYILKTIWYIITILLFYVSVWQDVWPKINVGHCDLYFMVQWICLISWKLFSSWTSYFRTMSPYDPKSDLKIFIGHCDLYFTVQWFCIISWRLFDVWTLYFVVISQCNADFALKQCRSQWFIFSWSIDFTLYLIVFDG